MFCDTICFQYQVYYDMKINWITGGKRDLIKKVFLRKTRLKV